MIKLTPLAAALAAVVFTGPALAEVAVSLPLHLGTDGAITTVAYSCADGTDLSVQYFNGKANSLALIPLKGADLIFVNVISGSGARYVSGARTWWTKGNDATLEDTLSDAGTLSCSAKNTRADQ